MKKSHSYPRVLIEAETLSVVIVGDADTRLQGRSCFFCKEKGHRQFNCPALRNRREMQGVRSQTVQAAAAVCEEATEDSVALVAEDDGNRLELSRPLVQVNSVCNKACELVALIDTGSPVSFVNIDMYDS